MMVIMAILKILNKNVNTRKLFGKRELAIIKKQLLGVALTQSEKNRLSRDIRKKFELIKELAPFSDEFELKKGAEIKEIIDDAKEVILESKHSKNIKRIVLYGSAVENRLTLTSDIDIAVDFDKIAKKEASGFRKEFVAKVNEKIDIQIYNILPKKIKKEIDGKGRIIYERKNKR